MNVPSSIIHNSKKNKNGNNTNDHQLMNAKQARGSQTMGYSQSLKGVRYWFMLLGAWNLKTLGEEKQPGAVRIVRGDENAQEFDPDDAGRFHPEITDVCSLRG